MDIKTAVLGVTICLVAIVLFVALISLIAWVVTFSNKKEKDKALLFGGKLSNTDYSIQSAMDYLKLTNGLEGDNYDGNSSR